MTGEGGDSGSGIAASTTFAMWNYHLGGAGSGGDLNVQGGNGRGRIRGVPTNGLGGQGGSSFFGAGGAGGYAQNESTDGANAVSPGAGGGGAGNDSTTANADGGDGANGLIRVTVYY